MRTTNWEKFRLRTNRRQNQRDTHSTRFQLHKPGLGPVFTSLLYDKYAPPVPKATVTLCCRECSEPKTTDVMPVEGATLDGIVEYLCERCSPKRRRRGSRLPTLAKRNPNAYTSFWCMKQRCTNPNNIAWEHYGGRGIKICNRWMDKKSGFENFLNDMGERTKDLSIDRIDVNGGYNPGNCRWATKEQQANNKRMSEEDEAQHAEYMKQFDLQ